MLISVGLVSFAFLVVFMFRLVTWVRRCKKSTNFKHQKYSSGPKTLLTREIWAHAKNSPTLPKAKSSTSYHRLKMLILVGLSILLSVTILWLVSISNQSWRLQTFLPVERNLSKVQAEEISRVELKPQSETFLMSSLSYICQVIDDGDFNEDYLVFTISLFFTIFVLIWNFFKSRAKVGSRCEAVDLFPVPVKPFDKTNRFVTAVIYAAYTYSI